MFMLFNQSPVPTSDRDKKMELVGEAAITRLQAELSARNFDYSNLEFEYNEYRSLNSPQQYLGTGSGVTNYVIQVGLASEAPYSRINPGAQATYDNAFVAATEVILSFPEFSAGADITTYGSVWESNQVVAPGPEPVFGGASEANEGYGFGDSKQGVVDSTVPEGSSPVNTQGDVSSASAPSLDSQIKASAGVDKLNWDQWNWYYNQITGNTPPNPEDRGLSRTDSGDVIINGSHTYSYETWKERAFGANFPGPQQPLNEVPSKLKVTDQIMDFIKRIWKFLISGI